MISPSSGGYKAVIISSRAGKGTQEAQEAQDIRAKPLVLHVPLVFHP
jgi:hypothetical protein